MATLPMMPPGGMPGLGGPGGPGGAPQLPPELLMALVQKLAGQARGAGAPPGAGPGLMGARSMAQTPFGKEQPDAEHVKAQLNSLVSRFLGRSPDIAEDFLKAVQYVSKGLEKMAKLPAAPVGAPSPGLPMSGGPAMMPTPDASPIG